MNAQRHTARAERTLRRREAIRMVWLEWIARSPFAHGPTAKDISRRLPFRLSDPGIRWHMRAIRDEAELAMLRDAESLSSRQCEQ